MNRRKAIILLFLLVCVIGFLRAQDLPEIRITTPLGMIVAEVDTLHAPVTAANFLNHVKIGTYDEAVFYRVVRPDNQPNNRVKIEVIQGGILNDEKIDKITPIPHETTKQTGLLHRDGTLSMARSAPGTASTEFFICIGDQPELDFGGSRNPDGQGFAAFGQVVKGMEVIRKIQQQKDRDQMLLEPVRILSVQIVP
jgi:peptidyl-prolyl cis-trans isomerase A (cyclophilin A)